MANSWKYPPQVLATTQMMPHIRYVCRFLIMSINGPSQAWIRIRYVIQFLGWIPDSTLSSKQVVPHPSKQNLHKYHEIMSHPSKLRFETWFVHVISTRVQWKWSGMQVVIPIGYGYGYIGFVMTSRIELELGGMYDPIVVCTTKATKTMTSNTMYWSMDAWLLALGLLGHGARARTLGSPKTQ